MLAVDEDRVLADLRTLAEFGKQGLDLGLLYDIELHTTMYQTYHPGTIVRWDALKTRGDHLCKFRISIPELASPNDPEYAAHEQNAKSQRKSR